MKKKQAERKKETQRPKATGRAATREANELREAVASADFAATGGQPSPEVQERFLFTLMAGMREAAAESEGLVRKVLAGVLRDARMDLAPGGPTLTLHPEAIEGLVTAFVEAARKTPSPVRFIPMAGGTYPWADVEAAERAMLRAESLTAEMCGYSDGTAEQRLISDCEDALRELIGEVRYLREKHGAVPPPPVEKLRIGRPR